MDPRSRTFKIALIVTLVAAFAIFTYSAMHYTSRPSFCASCHEIAPAVESWEASAHGEADVDCLACHAKKGTLGYIETKIGGLREVYIHLTTDVDTIRMNLKSSVPNEVCMNCHEDVPQETETSGMNFSHEKHVTLLQNCTDCHDRVVHGEKQKEFLHFNSLGSTCATCHGEQQKNDCQSCHKEM